MQNNFFRSQDIEFNSTGSYVNYGRGFESFFLYDEKDKLNCQVDSCQLVDLKSDGTCDTSLQGENIKLGPGPMYQITASETNSLGYEKKLCMKCNMKTISTKENVEIFNKKLEIKALPLNCSDHLKPTNYKPNPIPYNSGSEVEIGSGYRSFFSLSKKDDCKVEDCKMLSNECLEVEVPGLKIGGSPLF